MIMQMLFNGGGVQGPNKSDGLDNETGLAPSPWANLLSVGLKIISAVLGVTAGTDNNIDKVDNGGSSPMQVHIHTINIFIYFINLSTCCKKFIIDVV